LELAAGRVIRKFPQCVKITTSPENANGRFIYPDAVSGDRWAPLMRAHIAAKDISKHPASPRRGQACWAHSAEFLCALGNYSELSRSFFNFFSKKFIRKNGKNDPFREQVNRLILPKCSKLTNLS
jgi:hypothetical protein